MFSSCQPSLHALPVHPDVWAVVVIDIAGSASTAVPAPPAAASAAPAVSVASVVAA
jgi:hypothetical protein